MQSIIKQSVYNSKNKSKSKSKDKDKDKDRITDLNIDHRTIGMKIK
jgi:hypothetical protein